MGLLSVSDDDDGGCDRLTADGPPLHSHRWCPAMAGKQTEPLTTDEAKRRLRHAAREAGFSAWARREPLRVLALGLLAGMIFGSSPRIQDLIIRTLK